MKITTRAVFCLALLTTAACGTTDFSIAADDGGTRGDTDPSADVQVKPDADPKPDGGKDEAGKTTRDDAAPDAGSDSSKEDAKTPEDSGHDVETKDAGHDVVDHDTGSVAHDAGVDSGPPTCAGKAPYCGSKTVLQTCAVTDGGTTEVPTICPGPGECLNGACVECVPGSTQCTDNSHVETCQPDGTWGPAAACSSVINGTPTPNACIPGIGCGGVCVPGSTQCAAETSENTAVTGGGSCSATSGAQGEQECNNSGQWGWQNGGTWVPNGVRDCSPGDCGEPGAWCMAGACP